MKARGVPHAPAMNKMELAYSYVLESEKRTGVIREWRFQDLTLRLGHDCRYTPDFFVVREDWSLELHETKGHMRDDALVKLKVAARDFPFRVVLVRKTATGFERSEIHA